MKKGLLVGFAVIAVAASAVTTSAIMKPASAADLAPKPYYQPPPLAMPVMNWTGFYLGAVGGGGFADTRHTDGLGTTTGHFDQNGGTAGGTVGYNWQTGTFVFGLEGDLSWADITGSTSSNCLTSCFTTIRTFDTARARVGVAFDNWLPYITAGAAIADIHAGQSGSINGSTTRIGPTVGAGLEWMFAQHWSAKAEYLYSTFDSQATYSGATSVNVSERNVNLFRVGLDYHF
jgi:outer membrane immunogenic protein